MIRENLDFSIVWPVENLGTPRDFGTILFGLPGVGKTTIPFAIAKKLKWKLFYISPKDFVMENTNPELAIKKIFEEIGKKYESVKKEYEDYEKKVKSRRRASTKPKANMVFVFDEIDEFVVSREPTTDKNSRLLTTMMLPLFNDLREEAEKYNFIFFALTNHIRRFDTAITRKGRFDLVLPLGLPNRAGRYLWFENQITKLKKKYSENGFKIFDSHKETKIEIREKTAGKKKIPYTQQIDISDVDLNILSKASEGLSFGDIESVCKRVIESKLREESEIKEFLKWSIKDRRKNPLSIRIQTDYFLDWINKLRQSGKINHESLKQFNEDSLTYTRGSSSNTELNQIASETIKEVDEIDVKQEYEIDGKNLILEV